MTAFHTLENWLTWIDELSDRHYVIIDGFLNDELFSALRSYLFQQLDEFNQAGIGSLQKRHINPSIRRDFTYWIDPQKDSVLEPVWALLGETQTVLNRYCFLSLSGCEFHLAHYPPGAYYDRHIDQFSTRNNRMISMILYLNPDWQSGDGGELEIALDHEPVRLVEPIAKRAVLFKSAVVPHGVLEAHKDRFTLTGWFLYQPGILGPILE